MKVSEIDNTEDIEWMTKEQAVRSFVSDIHSKHFADAVCDNALQKWKFDFRCKADLKDPPHRWPVSRIESAILYAANNGLMQKDLEI